MALILVIGNKNYSSWSLRPWLVLKQAGIRFDEIRISLYNEESRACIMRYSPTGKVLTLIGGDITVWESLAICEYLGGGDFLFGRFSIADAMYASVALRFVTYDVELDPVSTFYVKTIISLPAIQQWVAEARVETEIIPQFELYT